MLTESMYQNIAKNVIEQSQAIEQLIDLNRKIAHFPAILDEDHLQLFLPIMLSFQSCLLQRLSVPPLQPGFDDVPAPIPQDMKKSDATHSTGNKIVIHEEIDLKQVTLPDFVRSMRRMYVERVINIHSGRKTKAARSMGITRQSIYSILRATQPTQIREKTANLENSPGLQ